MLSTQPDPLRPVLYTVLIHTGKGGEEREVEPVRKLEGCLLTRGVENAKKTDCISSLHINSIKQQKRWHLGFGVFIVIWSMVLVNIFYDGVRGPLSTYRVK